MNNSSKDRAATRLSAIVRRIFASAALALAVTACIFASSSAKAERLGDLANVVGARDNQLIGYGVVTGLNGTGDDVRARIAEQTLRSMLRRLGVQIDEKRLRLRNVAAVIVTATIPPFSRNGSRLDVTVSSLGNARSLAGGVLLQTPLRGADRRTYAVAQGSLVVGGFSARGRSGSRVQTNSTTTGRIVSGAIVEREIPTNLIQNGQPKEGEKDKTKAAESKGEEPAKDPTVTYSLRSPDFVTSQRIAQAINASLGSELAEAKDAGAVVIKLPDEFKKNPIPMLARLAELNVEPYQPARVVINERTGTIVAGGDVRLAPVAIAQGGISVAIEEQWNVSQPNPFAYRSGQTAVTPQSAIAPDEQAGQMKYIDGAATLSDVATALAALGVTPRELSSVMQALRSAGALRAEVLIQ